MSTIKKKQFADITDKLINLGENREELDFWRKIFDDLPEDKQHELIVLMLDELDQLQKTGQV